MQCLCLYRQALELERQTFLESMEDENERIEQLNRTMKCREERLARYEVRALWSQARAKGQSVLSL